MKQAYEAVVVRVTPDVVAGEMLNVGVLLLCREAGFLEFRATAQMQRVAAAFPDTDKVLLRRLLSAIRDGVEEHRARFAELPFEEFPSASAVLAAVVRPTDAMFQFSDPIVGLTADPEATLHRHLERYVGVAPPERPQPRTEDEVWRSFVRALRGEIAERIVPLVVRSAKHKLEQEFKHAWKNGAWNIVHPLSFDLSSAENIRDKAAHTVGKMVVLKPWEHDGIGQLCLLVGGSRRHDNPVAAAYRDALAILEDELSEFNVKVIPEADSTKLAARITSDIEAHLNDKSSEP